MPNVRMFLNLLFIDNWSINIKAASTIVWRDWIPPTDDDVDFGFIEESASLTMYFPFPLSTEGIPKKSFISTWNDKPRCDYITFMPELAVLIRRELGI